VTAPSPARRLLQALALDRRETFAWATYDWANSAFATTIITVVLPIYYRLVAGAELPGNTATVYWGYTTAIALLIVALLAPVLGAMADYLGAKKRYLLRFAVLGMVATALLALAGRGDWLFVSGVFIVANIGFAGANVFYDALLPHVADRDDINAVSSAGYAFGYLGGGLLLVLNSLWILSPQSFGLADAASASRLAMLSVAVWWAVFTVPLVRGVPEPPRSIGATEVPGAGSLRVGFGRLGATLRSIRSYRPVWLFLLAYWLYNDGIGTITKLATLYASEIGIPQADLVLAVIMTQFVGIPCAFAFGLLARRSGAKPALALALAVYTGVAILGYFMTRAWQFWLLAFLAATVQGGSQALSRSLYGSMVPRAQTSEFFSFYGISNKFAGILGPLLFAVIGQATGSSRLAILSLVAFFVLGLLLLARVDVAEGRRVAQEEDATYRLVPVD
jgi:UMF1 family MFS transporter